MGIAECQQLTNDSRVKVEERGKKAVFLNLARKRMAVTQVDGCLIVGATAADWIVTDPELGDVIVELKGKNVEYGARQILATAQYWRDSNYNLDRIAGLIVCVQYPRTSTTVQKAQQRFLREYRGPLHVVTKNYEFKLENVLSFRGPHKK